MCAPRARASTSSGCAYSRSMRSRTLRRTARSRSRPGSLVTAGIVSRHTAGAGVHSRPETFTIPSTSHRPRSPPMQTDADTAHALRDGDLCSEHLGMTWSVQALLRSWALDEHDLRQALRLTAQVATTAGRSEGGLMSFALSPHERSLRVTADDHDVEAPDLSLHVAEPEDGRLTFVV